WCYDRHRSVRLVVLVGLAIDQIAQSGLSSLSVIYYSAHLFSSELKGLSLQGLISQETWEDIASEKGSPRVDALLCDFSFSRSDDKQFLKSALVLPVIEDIHGAALMILFIPVKVNTAYQKNS
ncbi:hypothetical protein ABK668_26585, partial [Enterobacter hormaechei]|uniref:hypothetical protein n=1 Tax=Enterobacter hormaechei TaxID=158836 RepID=UPI0037510595